jgi:hypothetical protein
MMRKIWAAGAVLLAVFCAGNARAAIAFQYVTDAASYAAAAGSTVNVNVYVQEVDPTGTSSVIASKNGLFAYGLYVAGDQSATGASTISNYTTAAPFTQFGTGINPQTSSGPPPSGGAPGNYAGGLPPNSLDYSNANNTNTANGAATANGYKVLVGTLQVTAGSQTTFTLTSENNPSFLDPGFGGTAQADNTFTLPPGSGGFDLDTDGSAPQGAYQGANDFTYTFTVSTAAVPEPSSVLLAALFLPVAGFGVWLRRRKAVVAAA